MTARLEFFFDYVSPSSWLAYDLAAKTAQEVDAELVYRPVFLGGIMQATGNRPPGMVPAKGTYMAHDYKRIAAHLGIPFHMNPAFPFNTRSALRATIGLGDRTPEQAAFRTACFVAAWGEAEPKNLGEPDVMTDIAKRCGLDPEHITQLAQADENKAKLRANTDEAVERGMFGAPTFFVGDEMFFGHDRLDYAARALTA